MPCRRDQRVHPTLVPDVVAYKLQTTLCSPCERFQSRTRADRRRGTISSLCHRQLKRAAAERSVQRRSLGVRKSLLITLRAQAKVNKICFGVLTCALNDLGKQTNAGRQI